MMKLNNRFALAAIVALMAAPSAFAGTKFSVAGALDYGLNSTTVGTATIKGGLGYGGGVLVGFGLGSSAMFEVGGIYISRATQTTIGAITTTTRSSVVYIPGKIYFNLGKTIDLGVGGFYDYYTASGSTSDYGVAGNIRLVFPSGAHAFFIDAGYNQGLKSVGGVKGKGVLALIGMTFGK